MKYKGREVSKNIIDKRTPKKLRNNSDGDKYILKLFNTTKGKSSKTKKKNINAKKNKKPLSSNKFTKMDK